MTHKGEHSGRTSVELDWADERDPDGRRTARRLNLRARVVEASGPGGGWPVIRFEGDRRAVAALMAEYDS